MINMKGFNTLDNLYNYFFYNLLILHVMETHFPKFLFIMATVLPDWITNLICKTMN